MSRFDTTRWSLVLQARADAPAARAALETLCRLYRPPVVAYVRSRGYAPDAAEDLAQAFFAQFIEKAWHTGADPARGRFRAYLLTALKRHLIDDDAAAHALKRGGGHAHESIDAEGSVTPASDDSPERAFERAWALALLHAAIGHLQAEAEQAGKADLFRALREFLIEAPDEADYARVCAQLGLRRNTLAVAVHRMRHRLRELVQAELAQTTSNETEFNEEVIALRASLGTAIE